MGRVSVPRLQELERNLELSSGSFQRQLAAERKKNHEVQEEVRTLRDELERAGQKLKVTPPPPSPPYLFKSNNLLKGMINISFFFVERLLK